MTEGVGILVVRGLSKRFYGLQALDGVSFSLARGEALGLIGPNGAGKTTLFHCISGFLTPDSGEVLLNGKPVKGYGPHRIAVHGLGRTFQHNALFNRLTVAESLRIAVEQSPEPGDRARVAERVDEWVAFAGLAGRETEQADQLAHGLQRYLSIAMAAAVRPKVLLLDEPATGMNWEEKQRLSDMIRRLNQGHGIAIVLIDHDVRFVFGLTRRVVVLDHGQVIANGAPEAIVQDARVVRSYLGSDEQFLQSLTSPSSTAL